MTFTPELRRWLILDEGFVRHPYTDENSIWTFGVGHNLEANPLPLNVLGMLGSRSLVPLAFPQNLYLLQGVKIAPTASILKLLEDDVSALTFVPELPPGNQPREDALMNMGFNLGGPTFGEFGTFLGKISAQDWNGAAEDLTGTLVYRQLPERYGRIADTLRTNQYPPDLP